MAGTQLVTTQQDTGIAPAATTQYVTMRVGEALVGIPVHSVQDVIRYQAITIIPLTQRAVAGALNVRGRIVTAIDMRRRLALEDFPNPAAIMMVVVEYQHELFALMIDAVGDVLALASDEQERLPANMNDHWRSVASGIYKLDQDLLVIIDVSSVIDHLVKGHAA
jgi:purine-binding chemotaxis protein CheW